MSPLPPPTAPRLTQLQLLDAMTRLQKGDLTVQLPSCEDPTDNETARLFNAHVMQMKQLAGALAGVTGEIGTKGLLGSRIDMPELQGTWRDVTDNVNTMSANLTTNLRDLFSQITRIATADFTQDSYTKMSGELLETQQTLTIFSDQLAALHRELLRLTKARVDSEL